METIYRSIDGAVFYDKKQCEMHENNVMIRANKLFKTAIENLNEICKLCSCRNCPASALCNTSDMTWNGYLEGLD